MQSQCEQFDVLPDRLELLAKTLHVASSAERSPAARDHDDPHCCSLAAGDDRIVQFGGQLHVERVIGLRSIEGDRRNAITDIEDDLCITHGFSLAVRLTSDLVGLIDKTHGPIAVVVSNDTATT